MFQLSGTPAIKLAQSLLLNSQHKFIKVGMLVHVYILVDYMARLPSLLVQCQACQEISEAAQLLNFQHSLMAL